MDPQRPLETHSMLNLGGARNGTSALMVSGPDEDIAAVAGRP
jgi:hypothetical protein